MRVVRGRWLGRVVPLLALAVLAGSCRAVAVATDAEGSYAIDIHNSLGQPLSVAFDDGAGPRSLGAVGAGRQERFLVVRPARLQVAIFATGQTTGQTLRRDVTLRAGAPVTVRF
jgi:hypothetical protein